MASFLPRLLLLGTLLLAPALLPPASAQALAPLSATSASPHPALSAAPLPAWIEPPLDPLLEVALPEDPGSELDYLVSERQILVRERAAFVHFAYRVTSASSLGEAAELAFGFDPAYERIALHHIRLVREGVVEDRLDLSDFEVIRQERERDRALYDGRLTAIHQLRDVRVGDVIHYAYTVTGANPVFGPHYVEGLSLGWSRPVRQFRYRILRPPGADLPATATLPATAAPSGPATDQAAAAAPEAAPFHRVLGEVPWEPTRRRLADGTQELLWQRAPLPSLLVDSDRPDWHIGYPFLQLSDFRTWAEVVDWALPLYAAPPPEGALQAKIDALRSASEDPEARVLAALALVQNEVRYLGIELGPNSHRPSPPADTLARRFGDCKDKTLLLCTLLRALDLEADPALVNTSWGRPVATPLARAEPLPGLHASLPTPLAFDHVIARVRLPGGDVFWLDPTRLHQTGPLAERTSHDFGQALLIRPGSTDLIDMERPEGAIGRLHEEITLTSHGFEVPADLEIRSTLNGDRATRQRAILAGTTQAELSRDYLNYYLQKYPGLTAREPVSWKDDLANNRLEILERYSIPHYWEKLDSGLWRAEVYPHAVADLVRTPGGQTRHSPLALVRPSETLVHIRVLLHEDWEISAFDLTVEDAYLRYVSSTRAAGPREAFLTYHYQAKEDHVPASEVAAHAAQLAKIRGDLALSLTRDPTPATPAATADEPEPGFGLNLWSVALTVLVPALVGGVAWRRLRRAPGEPPPLPGHETPRLGGWLWLVALGVGLRAITLPVTFLQGAAPHYDLAIWENLTASDSAARDLPLAALMVGELVANLTLILLAWIAAWLFFTRRREAPAWNITVLVCIAVVPALDLVLAKQIGNEVTTAEWTTVWRSWIGSAIWVPYLLLSERVRRTFVR
jgi:hypothetical protein